MKDIVCEIFLIALECAERLGTIFEAPRILRDCLCGNARPVFLMTLNPCPAEKVPMGVRDANNPMVGGVTF